MSTTRVLSLGAVTFQIIGPRATENDARRQWSLPSPGSGIVLSQLTGSLWWRWVSYRTAARIATMVGAYLAEDLQPSLFREPLAALPACTACGCMRSAARYWLVNCDLRFWCTPYSCYLGRQVEKWLLTEARDMVTSYQSQLTREWRLWEANSGPVHF